MTKINNFADLVASFSGRGTETAMLIRRFVAIERTTYAQLQQQIYQYANYLSAQGLVAGDRVLLAAPNSPEWVQIFLACQLLGVITVNVDVQSTVDTVQKFADITSPKFLVVGDGLFNDLAKSFRLQSIGEIRVASATFPAKAPTQIIHATDQPAVIVFTSGTTADPKGVVLSAGNIFSNLEGTQEYFDVLPSWRFLSVLPLSHMYELTVGAMLPLYSGSSICYMNRVSPSGIARAMKDFHVTVIPAVPQLASLMLQKIEQTAQSHGQLGKLQFAFRLAPLLPFPLRRRLFSQVHKPLGGKLDIFAVGGAPMDPAVARKWELMGVKAVQGYGLTETSPLIAGNIIAKRRLDSQGKILSNISWRLSPDGELQVKGPNVFLEYYRNLDATKAAFTDDGYFKTGDLAAVDVDGWVKIFGRAKFAIVLPSGLKVFPEDVEQTAITHAAIKDICVIGQKTVDGEAVHAIIISDKPDKEVDAAIAEVNGRIESFQHISGWSRYPDKEFPRSRLGKIERKKVIGWAQDQSTTSESATVAITDDPVLTAITKVLPHLPKQPSDADVLASIGLDSLRRLALVSILEEQSGIIVAETDINQRTTLGDLRRLIVDARPVAPEPERTSWQLRPVVRWLGSGIRDGLFTPLSRIFVKWRVYGEKNMPKNTPVLIAFNHIDNFDTVITYASVPRSVRNRLAAATGDDVMREHSVLAFVARFAFAGFNFARQEPILPSLRYTADLVDQGWSIAIAPEGHISRNGQLQPFKSGVGLLAVELGIPVVPVTSVGLYGTMPWNKFWPQKKTWCSVIIGEPITFDKDTSYDDATALIYERMKRQIEQHIPTVDKQK